MNDNDRAIEILRAYDLYGSYNQAARAFERVTNAVTHLS